MMRDKMWLAGSAVNSVDSVNVLKLRHLWPHTGQDGPSRAPSSLATPRARYSLAALILTLSSLAAAVARPISAATTWPQTPADSTAYRLDTSSVLEVHVGKSGLLAGLGHEHRVRARAFRGRVVYVPSQPQRSHVAVTVLADSLEIVAESDSADVPKIAATMRNRTLRVEQFPEITFVSHEVTPIPGGVRVTGDLTLTGHTRPVSVDLRLEVSGDTLRASGSFSIKQTAFGIEPYRTALGLVKVKDEVRFDLAVVAIAEQSR
jgi:polyisoprenoid-binding protein YceI